MNHVRLKVPKLGTVINTFKLYSHLAVAYSALNSAKKMNWCKMLFGRCWPTFVSSVLWFKQFDCRKNWIYKPHIITNNILFSIDVNIYYKYKLSHIIKLSNITYSRYIFVKIEILWWLLFLYLLNLNGEHAEYMLFDE